MANDEEAKSSQESETEDEEIIVTRQEEERDPQAEEEFDRELAKMMAESLDARKFERKPLFDVPLPMRRRERDASIAEEDRPSPPENTMAFSLLTKRGNRQQVCFTNLYSCLF